jgi:ParB-like chromosome segregation protein Spo0J
MISATAAEKPSVAWPAAKVEIWPIERLTANPRNARIHGPEQIEQIRASLREFGWTMPVLVRENGMLIAGHGRLEAAKLEGLPRLRRSLPAPGPKRNAKRMRLRTTN